MLKDEFPDISISKIRYLEDQGLLAPRRTEGGYRLFSEDDVERLERILRLQRDEFLPLRVIRQELASSGARDRKRRRAGLVEAERELDLEELCERAGIDARLARELEEFGLLAPRTESGEKRYRDLDADIALACGRLAQFGIAPRHLRGFRTAADREAALIEQVVGPALRARNPERRRAGMEDLESLGFPDDIHESFGKLITKPYGMILVTGPTGSGKTTTLAGLRQHDPVNLAEKVREVPDWPQPGVGFKDVTPLLADPEALAYSIEQLAEWGAQKQPDLIVGAEARGFILGAAIAKQIGCGFVPARRPGKLPPETISATYALEYGQNALELHPDMVPHGARVLIHDDVLATGGTVEAIAEQLVERLGGVVVGCCFIIELGFLKGRERLSKYDLHALIEY